jgi:cyclic pyranopterin phosphate synthase
VDGYGRVHRDLRVSLTDRCNLRCTYCMPADFAEWIPGDHLLSARELVEVIAIGTELGIDQVRLTGGEPLLRPDIVEIVEAIARLPRAPRISLTTNGIRLAELAEPLKAAGLERVNVSLDTLDRQRFIELTKRDRLDDVLAGIAAAQAAGLTPLKVNAVLMAGVNDDEAVPMLRHALANGWNLRFIEQMPLDAGGIWDRTRMITAQRIHELLSEHFALEAVPNRGSAPAEEFRIDGTDRTVGIIASVSSPFCGSCDRLRLTADGQLRNCLFARDETDLRTVLRDPELSEGQRRDAVVRLYASSTLAKAAGHGIDDPSFIQPARPMSAIGG